MYHSSVSTRSACGSNDSVASSLKWITASSQMVPLTIVTRRRFAGGADLKRWFVFRPLSHLPSGKPPTRNYGQWNHLGRCGYPFQGGCDGII